MTINNKEAYMNALWDWGFLNDCFAGTLITVSDVDGIVERNGHVLFIEAKPPRKKISRGQQILFQNLAQSGFTVLCIWGETNKPERAQIYKAKQPQPGKEFDVDETKVREIVRLWFVWANQMPPKSVLDKQERWPLTIQLQINE